MEKIKILVPEVKEIYFPMLTVKDLPKILKAIKKGNIQAKLSLIMHNQAVMNEKLNKILKRK